MNTSGEAADQVMRMMLNGTEVLLKLSGTGAKNAAVLLYSMAKQQKKTKGSARLESMLRSGKPLKVYTFKAEDLPKFKEVAKQYGILYTVLKEKDKTDGVFDVMVRAEDESKIARITERFNLAQVDVATLRAEIVKEQEEKKESDQEAQNPPETEYPEKDASEKLADEMLAKPIQREEPTVENPTAARSDKSPKENPEVLSERSSNSVSPKSDRSMKQEGKADRKPSVKKKIEDIKKEREERKKNPPKAPEKSKSKGKSKSKKKERNAR
jgi:hypothetical protein